MVDATGPHRLRTEYAENPLGIDSRPPRFSWELPRRPNRQVAYRLLVASSSAALDRERADVWDSGWIPSDRSIDVTYEGPHLDSVTRYHWKVGVEDDAGTTAWSEPAWFETGLPETEWAADWIAGANDDGEAPAPLLRREVDLGARVERARAYVAAAGYYELTINGKRVGESVLDTARTDYEERVLYATHDVTDLLTDGSNVVGAVLGRDWYALTTENAWGWERTPWTRDRPAVRIQIEIEHVDGTQTSLTSDDSWRTTDSPTRFDSVYTGEVYDAREAIPDWGDPEYDDSGWDAATIVDGPDGKLVPQTMQPMEVVARLEPVAIDEPEPGVYVFDFGRTTAGWTELTVDGPEGAEIQLTHGEKLHDDGTVDVEYDGVDGTLQTDTYVCAGEGVETWTPRFSYKGFQYVEVRGFPGTPTADALTAEIVHSAVDSESKSGFTCANPLLTRIHDMAGRTFLNNCHGVPTDTPKYEKNGWVSAHVGVELALLNFDVTRFFTKWLDDFTDAQREDGEIPPIIPTSDWGYSDRPMDGVIFAPTPAEDIAYVFVPWALYRYCGDRRILEDHFEGMCAFAASLDSYASDGVLDVGIGDWLAPTGHPMRGTPPEGVAIASTAHYYRLTEILADVAGLLDRTTERERLARQADGIAAGFNDAFFDPETSVYATGKTDEYRQTSNILPLQFGLVPDDHEAAVVANLVEDVAETRNGHLNTGFYGTKYLLPLLTEYGHLDLAYTVATKTDYPSWGHWIEEQDATTIYESWELDSRSRNHFQFGAIDEWFYEFLVGIQPAEPGYRTVTVDPRVPSALSSAAATVDTVRGEVSAAWERTDGAFTLDVTIPGNTEANVRLRGREDVHVASAPDGKVLADVGADEVGWTAKIGPGDWSFVASE